MAASATKPRVLILGGIGFIGRNLTKHIVDNNAASFLRVVDKVMPTTAYLSKEHQAALESAGVEYKQGNLNNEGSIAKIFTIDGGKFDIVFNLAGETKYGQTEEVYREKILDVSVKCAKEAVKQGVARYIEVSTAQVYSADKKASSEDGKLKPWTGIANFKLQAEEQLKAMTGLPLTIVRPAIVYGPGDVAGLSPRIICGAVYKHLNKKMKFLWSGDLKINTVHVRDAVKALWTIATNAKAVGKVYNLADKNDTNQKKVNQILEPIFGIKTGFAGGVISQLAKMNLKSVTEEVNDRHLKPWADLCKKCTIVNSPLTPYLDQELLYNNSLAVDGSKIEDELGFRYDYPALTEELVREQIDYFVKQNLFPPLESITPVGDGGGDDDEGDEEEEK